MTSEDRVLKTQKADHRSLWFIEPRKVKATEQWKGVVSVFMLIKKLRECTHLDWRSETTHCSSLRSEGSKIFIVFPGSNIH